jgi:SagB-type dehydrogenase family enzyme
MLTYKWSSGVKLAEGGVLETPRGPVTFSSLDDGQLAVLRAFDGLGSSEDEIVAARGDGSVEATAWVHLIMNRLLQLGVVDRVIGDPPFATIEVIGNNYLPAQRALPDGARVRLSRFAYMRQDDEALTLESTRSRGRIVLHAPAAAALLAVLARAQTIGELSCDDDGLELLGALFREGFLEPEQVDAAVLEQNPEARALSEWEFHDLLFHGRSRQGLHRNPYGGTYRFEGEREPLPAVKEFVSETVIALPKPDLGALKADDMPFAAVVETRRSLRMPGPTPLTINQLGEFLFRSARVRGRRGTEHEEVSNRPYPGGGADYELEIYPIVHRVAGVDSGLYWYNPLEHALVRMADFGGLVERFAADTVFKAPPGTIPDVMFAITARIGRLTYKYQSIPYAVALKDLGVLYQTFYLTATAMGLAPCAVGGGDSDVFAAASGLSTFVEPQIGEFLLNTRHPDEYAASAIPPG